MNQHHNGQPDDPIAAAIAEVENQGQKVEMIAIPVQISETGRPAQVAIPIDATDEELAALAGWLLTAVRNDRRNYRQQQAAKRLVVATSLPPGRPA